MDSPKLIEPTAKYFLYHTLNKCHEHRTQIYVFAFNLCILIVFVLVVGITLYLCYRKKPTSEELRQKMLRDQQYVLSKIRFYQGENRKQKEHTSEITNLPVIAK
jgi:hypothetical protein